MIHKMLRIISHIPLVLPKITKQLLHNPFFFVTLSDWIFFAKNLDFTPKNMSYGRIKNFYGQIFKTKSSRFSTPDWSLPVCSNFHPTLAPNM